MKKICILILNWNRPSVTLETLSSVKKLKKPKSSILLVVLVDNASKDDSVEVFKKFKKENINMDIEIIQNNQNLGYAGGNNVGLRYAIRYAFDYVLVLNNDVILKENLLVEMLKAHEQYPQYSIFSPKIYFAKGHEFHKNRYTAKDLGKVIWYGGGVIDWKNIYSTHRGLNEVDKGQFDICIETEVASGTCMFISKEVLGNVVFDEKLFMYWDDVDFSLRARQKGYRILFVPNTHIWHKVSASSKIGSDLNDYYLTRNRMVIGMRYASLRAKIALLRESLYFFLKGRQWQKKAILDFYIGKMGKGIN